MKRILFIVALLPFLVKSQSINNQKVRWMQPIYMGNNTPAALNSSADTSAFFFNAADSLLYFKYKGSSRAIAYTSTVPTIDSFTYATRARVYKVRDSVASVNAATYQPIGNYLTLADSATFSTKAYRQKGIDSIAAVRLACTLSIPFCLYALVENVALSASVR